MEEETCTPCRRVWLLFGWRGWIGGKVRTILEARGEVVHLATSRAEDAEQEILRLNPTHVVAWIGRTHGPGCNTIDYLEPREKLVENLNDNLYSTLKLAMLSTKHGFHLTSGGTGCIFEYTDEKRVFSESDDPNFFGSSYSVVKGFADRLLRDFPNVLNARIRMPIDDRPGPRNFLTKIINYPKIHSVENSMTVLPDLLPRLVDLAIAGETGALNVVNPGTISHAAILKMYVELVDAGHAYELVDDLDGLVAARRSNNELDTTRIEKLCGPVPGIEASVRRLFSTSYSSSQINS